MKTRSRAMTATAFVSLCALLSGCNSAQSDWVKASNENTITAYQNFLAAHPKDQHASEAQAMILQEQDNNEWQEAQHTNTAASYQTYLQLFPQGSHATAAKDAMTAIDRGTAWKSAQDAGTAVAFKAFLEKYPTGPDSDQATATLRDLTGYRVHLASETTDAKAQRKLSRLKSKLGEQASDLKITPDASGKSFSIDSESMTEYQAKDTCVAIKQKHESCEVVEN